MNFSAQRSVTVFHIENKDGLQTDVTATRGFLIVNAIR